ncbi:MAG TPA: DUF4440 domain-containing protein [Novosphingobium sp.]|nr:DUF4440 domain-containing protein [Novosphingobium sp.]
MNGSANVIGALDSEWAAMIDAHDLDGVVELYDKEGSFLIPGQPALEGQGAIRSAWAHLFGLPEFKLRFEPLSVIVASGDDIAMDRGSYELSHRDENGLSVDKGKYLVVWRKSCNGEWKILADIFNSNG